MRLTRAAGLLEARGGDTAAADALFAAGLAAQPRNAQLLHAAAQLAAARGRPGEARRLLGALLRAHPGNGIAWVALARLAQADGQADAAAAALDKWAALLGKAFRVNVVQQSSVKTMGMASLEARGEPVQT